MKTPQPKSCLLYVLPLMHSMKKRGNSTSAYEDYFLYMPSSPFSSLC